MKVTDRHFLSADHKNHIHVKIWEPEGNVQGVIQIAHGMIDYITHYPGVDTERIGILGICGVADIL